MLIISAFLFYKYLIIKSSLFSVGLVSFVLIAQLAPSFLGLYFGERGSYYGAVTGIIAGIIICYINLIIPQYIQTINPEFSLDNYRILEFFKIPYFIYHCTSFFFWSILVNSFLLP